MGFFSSVCSIISPAKTEPGPKVLRETHGFTGFDADMERLRNYDPVAELEKADAQQSSAGSAKSSKTDIQGGRR